MLGVFMGPDNQGITIHQTYLTAEGKKMDLEEPKRFMPALKKMLGGAIRLYDPDNRVGVGEGIETMLSAAEQTGIPTWATLTSSLLVGFEPPPGVEHLYIFGDNDKNYAGQRWPTACSPRPSTAIFSSRSISLIRTAWTGMISWCLRMPIRSSVGESDGATKDQRNVVRLQRSEGWM